MIHVVMSCSAAIYTFQFGIRMLHRQRCAITLRVVSHFLLRHFSNLNTP